MVAGTDVLRKELVALCREAGASLAYEELDPDVFGSELDGAAYADVERIAAVGAVITASDAQPSREEQPSNLASSSDTLQLSGKIRTAGSGTNSQFA